MYYYSHSYRKRIISFVNPELSLMRTQMIRAFADRNREKLLLLSGAINTAGTARDDYGDKRPVTAYA